MLTVEFELDTVADIDAEAVADSCRAAAQRCVEHLGAAVQSSQAEYELRLAPADDLLASGDVVVRIDLAYDGDSSELLARAQQEVSAEARRLGAEVHELAGHAAPAPKGRRRRPAR